MKNSKIGTGINDNDSAEGIICPPCLEGKHKSSPFKGRLINNVTEPGEVIFFEVCGPIDCESWSKLKILRPFIDRYSCHNHVETINLKKEVTEKFVEYKKLFENQYQIMIKRLHTNNVGEFVNEKMSNFCKQNSIIHKITAPYNSESNGAAERIIKTILDRVHTILAESGLTQNF